MYLASGSSGFANDSRLRSGRALDKSATTAELVYNGSIETQMGGCRS